MKKVNLSIIILFLLASISLGNFRIIALNGGNIATAGKTSVRIEKERVTIKLFRDSCLVKCKFWVKSTMRDEVLTVAFPNSLIDFNIFRDSSNRGVSNFKARFDGKSVVFAVKKDTTKAFGLFYDNLWFVFKTEIKKDSTHIIECAYKDKWYSDYSYLIGSGVTWNGTIGSGTIVFDHSAICSKNFVYSPKTYSEEKDLSIPTKLIPIQYQDSLVYSFSNYKPDSSEVVRIHIQKYWTDSTEFPEYLQKPIIFDLHNGWIYGWKNKFIFNYLADSTHFNHAYDYAAIKSELLTRTQNIPSNKLSAGEKACVEVLSNDLDSLKERILSGVHHSGTAEIHISSISTLGDDTKIRDELYNRGKRLNSAIEKIASLYLDDVQGKLQLTFTVDTSGQIEFIQYDSNIKSREGIETILIALGISKKPIFLRFPKKCAKINIEATVKIFERKKSPFPASFR